MIFYDSKPIESFHLPFNWGADYNDNTYITEFDLNTKEKNDFYSIEQNKIVRFGLFGCGMKMFYDRDGGININGKRIDIEYHTDNEIFLLTCQDSQKDCITYKQAYIKPDRSKSVQDTKIESINFGYKTLLNINETQFYFQPIVSIPMEGVAEIDIKLTSNKNLDGKLVFRGDKGIIDIFEAPLQINHAGTMRWTIQ